MFQWVSHGTENIGNYVDNNHQRANHHHSGGDRRVVLLANSVDQPAAGPGQPDTISVIIARSEHGGKLRAETRDHRRRGVVETMAPVNFASPFVQVAAAFT